MAAVSNSFGEGVPKIIHQTYFTHDLPAQIRINVEQIRRSHANWKYCFYDDEDIVDFISHAYGRNMLSSYMKINSRYGAARADLFRYLLMYEEGGVYLDMKSTTTCALDTVLREDDQFVLSHWPNGRGERYENWGLHPELGQTGRGEFQQWHIIAAPRHPFLEAVINTALQRIDRYNVLKSGTGYLGVLRTTGPICYTQAIRPLMAQHACRMVDDHESLGLEYAVQDSHKVWIHRQVHAHAHYSQLHEPVVLRTPWQKLWLRTLRMWEARPLRRANFPAH